MRQPSKLRNKVAILTIATAGLHGKDFYIDAKREIEQVATIAKWCPDRFTRIIAASSPRCSVVRNIRLSLHWMVNGVMPTGTMKMISKACAAIDDGGDVSGPKVSAFYANLRGNDDCITWDTHMFACFNCHNPTKAKKSELATMEWILRDVAAELGLTPAQCQAAVWAGWRGISGWNVASFPVLREYFEFIK